MSVMFKVGKERQEKEAFRTNEGKNKEKSNTPQLHEMRCESQINVELKNEMAAACFKYYPKCNKLISTTMQYFLIIDMETFLRSNYVIIKHQNVQ